MMGILEQISLYTLLDEVHQPEGHTVKHTRRVGGLRPTMYEIKIIISPYKITEKDAIIVR